MHVACMHACVCVCVCECGIVWVCHCLAVSLCQLCVCACVRVCMDAIQIAGTTPSVFPDLRTRAHNRHLPCTRETLRTRSMKRCVHVCALCMMGVYACVPVYPHDLYICLCVCIISISIYEYLCIYTYTYTHTHTHTHLLHNFIA